MNLYDETDCLPHVKPAPLIGWQPIETAPKDKWVLGFGDGPASMLCAFIMEWSEGDGWVEIYSDAEFQPTHWMPLPAPPVADAVLREAGE